VPREIEHADQHGVGQHQILVEHIAVEGDGRSTRPVTPSLAFGNADHIFHIAALIKSAIRLAFFHEVKVEQVGEFLQDFVIALPPCRQPFKMARKQELFALIEGLAVGVFQWWRNPHPARLGVLHRHAPRRAWIAAPAHQIVDVRGIHGGFRNRHRIDVGPLIGRVDEEFAVLRVVVQQRQGVAHLHPPIEFRPLRRGFRHPVQLFNDVNHLLDAFGTAMEIISNFGVFPGNTAHPSAATITQRPRIVFGTATSDPLLKTGPPFRLGLRLCSRARLQGSR
jgi:hypothetical protein